MAEVFPKSAPTGSALSQMRDLVSWTFFRDTFRQSVRAFCKNLRPSWRGFYLTAVDGDQYCIPRNDDTVSAGYKGQSCGINLETYGMKMYVALGCDVITGAPLALVPHENANELQCGIRVTREVYDAQKQKKRSKFNSNSHLFIYDRLYLCGELLELHAEFGTSFVVRCKRGGTFLEVISFWNSTETERICEINGHSIRLVRAIHNGEVYVYATNVRLDRLGSDSIAWLYLRRWEIETTNSYGAQILVLEKFHTHKSNGILQEIFASLWSLLLAKCACGNFKAQSEEFAQKIYHRANLKRLRNVVMKNIRQIFSRITMKLLQTIEDMIKSTTRTRERLSRKAPRMRRYKRLKKYATAKPVAKG